ncbi:MAG: BatD family protein [Candidatus Theseobacter exili]|nr:BatD family protein [Candidatus Theseobacter exili]
MLLKYKLFYILMVGFISLIYGDFHFVYAGNVSIHAEINKKEIPIGSSAILTVTLQGESGSVKRPSLPAVTGIECFSSGSSRSYSIVNGIVSSKNAFTYTLVPKKIGRIIIPPITATVEGNKVSTEPLTVEVIKGRKGSLITREESTKELPAISSESKDAETPVVFITMDADKNKAYVNEQVTLIFKLFRRVNLLDQPAYSPPGLTGLWVGDLPPENPYYQIINNERYIVSEIKKAIFPTTPGEAVIGSASLQCVIPDFSRSRKRDMFSVFDRDPFEMFNRDPFGMFGGKKVLLKTEPVSIQVMALPEKGQPGNFSGTVGQFSIKANVDKRTIPAGQPISLKVEISGKGNINTVKEPVFTETSEFKVYESGSSMDISKQRGILGGRKIFEKVLIPRKEGKYELPYMEFSYFDPKTGNYRTVKTKQIPVAVSASTIEEETSAIIPEGISKEKIKYLGKDIHHIRTQIGLMGKSMIGIKQILLLYAFPFLALVLGAGVYQHKKRLLSDDGFARSRKAKKWAEKRFSDAKKALKQKDTGEFYRSLSRAITNFIADRTNLPAGGLHRNEVKSVLIKAKVAELMIDKVDKFFEKTDMATFAKGVVNEETMTKDMKEAAEVLSLLRQIKFNNGNKSNVSWFLIILFILFFVKTSEAAQPEYVRELFEKGNKYYQTSHYEDAAESYRKILDMGFYSGNLYYNLGNCYYRIGKIGKAILYYKKAGKLSKRDKDIADNLEIAMLRCKDKQPEEKIPIWTYSVYALGKYLSKNERTWLLTGCIWLFVVITVILLFKLGMRTVLSKFLLIIIIFVIFVGISLWKEMYEEKNSPEAVVIINESTARSGPGDQYKTTFELHEGTCVKIIKRKLTWYLVKLPNKMEGWMPANQIEEI